jgi:hypothetical protein
MSSSPGLDALDTPDEDEEVEASPVATMPNWWPVIIL